jgi:6-phosphofructokinase 1
MKKIAVLTSGGDAPGMNSALRAVVKVSVRNGVEVLGVEQGYEGLIDGNFRPLRLVDVDAIGSLGGTILGSARSKRFREPEGRARAASHLADLEGLVVIGGNGSLTGAKILGEETGVRVVGIPASIDNDIGCTRPAIGVDSALNTIVSCTDRISDTARAHRRVFIVEVMGRQCGYLAMASAVAAGADAVLYREQGKDEDTIVEELRTIVRKSLSSIRGKQQVLVIKAEGVQVPTDRLVKRLQTYVDADHPGVDVRGTVLGHLVRGGNPSFRDRMLSGRLSVRAVERLLAGRTSEMVAWAPDRSDGESTPDPFVRAFTLDRMIEATASLLDGTSPITQGRVRMMEAFEGVLAL